MAFMEQLQHLNIQLEEIKLATENFGDNNVIGSGGFGEVYKGEISHSEGKRTVAIKRLDRKYGQGDPEFLKEIMFLSRYRHENLISLLGFCNEDGEKILVYEYASRGSFDRHLSDATLTWCQRLKICLAVAKGLSYLHDPNGTHQRVIHCDIKSANILLDENWNAKVSDFGLSKLGPANQQHTFLVTNLIGTHGYCDPVYMETYTLTKKSDVYSFGVVLLEALCGRLCFEYNDGRLKVLVPMWKQRYEEKKLDLIILQDLKKQMNLRSLESFSDIAYKCLEKSREVRPTMSHIVQELELALKLQDTYEGKEIIGGDELLIRYENTNSSYEDIYEGREPAHYKRMIMNNEEIMEEEEPLRRVIENTNSRNEDIYEGREPAHYKKMIKNDEEIMEEEEPLRRVIENMNSRNEVIYEGREPTHYKKMIKNDEEIMEEVEPLRRVIENTNSRNETLHTNV